MRCALLHQANAPERIMTHDDTRVVEVPLFWCCFLFSFRRHLDRDDDGDTVTVNPEENHPIWTYQPRMPLSRAG